MRLGESFFVPCRVWGGWLELFSLIECAAFPDLDKM